MTAPKVEKLAYLEYTLGGYSASWSTREKDARCAIKVPSPEAVLASLQNRAPSSEVPSLYVHMGSAIYRRRVDILEAVKAAGYEPIVLGFAFDATVILAQAGIKCKTGESILVVSSAGGFDQKGFVYILRKTEKEYEVVPTSMSSIPDLLATNPTIKYAIYDAEVTNMDQDVKLLRKVFKKNFRFLTLVERPLSSYLWDLVDLGKVKGYSVKETCGISFKFMWNDKQTFHSMMSTVKPTKETVKIDIGSAGRLMITGAFPNGDFDLMKTYVFRHPSNRIVDVAITFDEDHFPEFKLTVAERTSITNDAVFFELYYRKTTNTFTGTYFAPDRMPPLIENAISPATVFKNMTTTPAVTPSIGIFVNGGPLPLNLHRKVIESLPNPDLEVCFLYPQFYLSLYLRESGIKCDVGEYIVFALCKNVNDFDFAVLQKTKDGFKGIGTGYTFQHGFEYSRVVVAVEHGLSNCCRKNLTLWFHEKEFIVASWDKVLVGSEVDCARDFLTGQHYNGYMMEPYLGMKFTFQAGGESISINKTFDWVFDGHVETLPIGSGNGIAEVKVALFGFEGEEVVTSVAYPAAKGNRNAVLTLSVDRHLVPTAEIEIKEVPGPTNIVADNISEDVVKFFANQSNDNPIVIVISTNDENLTFLQFSSHAAIYWPHSFPDRAAMYAQIAELTKERNIIGVVEPYPDSLPFPQRRQRHALLKRANLSNVKLMNANCSVFSSHLARVDANLHVAVGETVILLNSDIAVLKRHADGYQVLDVSRNDLLQICKEHGTNFIIVYTEKDNVDSVVVEKVKERLAPRTVVISELSADASHLPSYYHSLFDAKTSNDYKVSDYMNLKVVVKHGLEKHIFKTGFMSPPHDHKTELFLGEAMSVEVAAMSAQDFLSLKPELVKTFTMKSKKRRLVALTLRIIDPYNVDASLDVLEHGSAPRIVLIHRQAEGYSRTVLTENSPKANNEVFSTVMAAIQSYKSPTGCSIVVDVAMATLDERTKLHAFTKQLGYTAALGMHTICLDINKLLFSYEGFECNTGESVFLMDMTQQSQSRSYVIRHDHTGYHLLRASKDIEKLRSAFPLVRRAFVAKPSEVPTPTVGGDIGVTVLGPFAPANTTLYRFLASALAGDTSFDRPHVANFTGIVFTARWGKKSENVEVGFASVPFSDTVVFHVGMAETLKINMTSLCSSKSELVKQFNFRSPANRVIVLELAVDRNLQPSATLIRADRVPTLGLKFTTDNRVLIRAGADYTGDESIPAYLSFTDDFKVGTEAQELMKTSPNLVVYDLVRLLANDFDPCLGADPSWQFAAWRDFDVGVMVELGEKLASVVALFAIVVRSLLRYIKQNSNNAVEEVGIQLPKGSIISEDFRSDISDRLGVNLIIYYY
uniref:FIST domain-containing protein n=1 Tax=Panagrellus redivivus TaxID=6233 RepID=A0A7E4V9S0_PANRE